MSGSVPGRPSRSRRFPRRLFAVGDRWSPIGTFHWQCARLVPWLGGSSGWAFSPACGELVALDGYVGSWWSMSNRPSRETVQARMQSHEQSDAPEASPIVRGAIMSDEGGARLGSGRGLHTGSVAGELRSVVLRRAVRQLHGWRPRPASARRVRAPVGGGLFPPDDQRVAARPHRAQRSGSLDHRRRVWSVRSRIVPPRSRR